MLDIFEQKNNTVAFVLVIVAAVIYSSLGLFSAIAQSANIPFLLLITVGTLFALIVNIIFLLIRKITFKTSVSLVFSNAQIRKLFYIRLLLSSHTFLIIGGFYLLINKNFGVLAYEMHPIISIIFSYFLLSGNYEKESNFIYSWTLIIISAIGISIISYQEIAMTREGLFMQVIGMFLVLLATIFRGIIAPIAPKMNILLAQNDLNLNKFDNALIVQFLTLLFLLPVLALVSVLLYGVESLPLLQANSIILMGVILGVIIFGSAILHNISGVIATTHNIYLGYFIAPFTGLMLLYWFGYGQINSNIALVLILILAPNILLNIKIEDSFSFKATFIWILLFAIVLFYTQGKPINAGTYFNSSNSLLVFFALMVGYLITKLNERGRFREQLFMQFLHKLRKNGINESSLDSLSVTFQQSNNRITDKVKTKLLELQIKAQDYKELLDFKFIQNRRLYNAGELFVLLLVSLLLMGITITYRENNFLYDSYAFIINTAVVFTLAQVIERMFFSEYQSNKPAKEAFMESIVGMASLTVLIIAIIVLFLSKHGFVV